MNKTGGISFQADFQDLRSCHCFVENRHMRARKMSIEGSLIGPALDHPQTVGFVDIHGVSVIEAAEIY
jgi:hypothetical protein